MAQEYNVLYFRKEYERIVDKMELAWNTQKNKLSDVKGKEMEQERKGKLKNKDIDLSRTKCNIDLVISEKNLYQRVKERVDHLKKSGSRVQKNSVVMYSNILTVSEEQANIWGEEKTEQYFKKCYEFFCNEFGEENVVSAKVHKDETSPHMHLHFVPVNKENGRLQARVSMNKEKVNYIHDELPLFLQKHGFDVFRAAGKTKDNNIEDVHEYKEIKKQVEDLEQVVTATAMNIEQLSKKRWELINENETVKREIEKRKEQLDSLTQNISFSKSVKELTQNVVYEKNLLGKKTGNFIIPEDDFRKIYGYAKKSFEKNREVIELKDKLLFDQSGLREKNKKLQSENNIMKKDLSFLRENLALEKKEKEMIQADKNELQRKNSFHENFLRQRNLLEIFQGWLEEQKKKLGKIKQEKEIKKKKNRGMER